MNKIKSAYNKMSGPMKASVYFTLCNILQRGISMITAPIFTRLLTTEQYGIYSVYNSCYSIISIFATFNLSYGVFITGLIKFEQDRNRFISSLQGLSMLLTTISLIVYLTFQNFWNQFLGISTTLAVLMFVELFFVPAFSFWSNVQRNEYKYRALVFATLAMSIGSAGLGIVAVMLSTANKAEARIAAGILVQIFVAVPLCIMQFVKGKTFFDRKYWKYALSFNFPLLPHYLSMTILQQSDRIMIGNMVGSSEAAIYSVAYTVSSIMTLVTQAINNSFTPYTYQSIKKHNIESVRKSANSLLVLVGIGCLLVASFGPEVIMIMAPKSYYDAMWIIPPVAASVYFMFLYPLFGNVEFYFEKTKFTMLASCGGAVLNIVLNYVFIPIFGYYAAGYTTLVCYICFAFAHSLVYKSIEKGELQGEKIYDLKRICLISIVLLLFMAALLFMYSNFYIRYGVIIIVSIISITMRKKIVNSIKNIRKI